jgi:hypothetical protein
MLSDADFWRNIMETQPDNRSRFMGTYFDPSTVIRLSKVAEIAAWVVVVVYALDLTLAAGTFALSYIRGFWYGLGFTDFANNVIVIIERPFRGVVYFIALQAIAKVMLIFLDIEENLRRTARNTTPKA